MKKLIVLLCLIFIPALTASDTSTYVLAVSGQDAGATNYTQDASIISWWFFEDSSTPSLDGSANNNDLTWPDTDVSQTSTHVQGTYGIDFDPSTSDHASITDANLSPSTFPGKSSTGSQAGFTVGVWVRLDADPSGDQQVLGKWNQTTSQMSYRLVYDHSETDFAVEWSEFGWGNIVSLPATSTASTETWTLLVATFVADAGVYFYVGEDGYAATTQYFQADSTLAIFLGTADLVIGRKQYALDEMSGQVDEMFFLSRVLSKNEIDEILSSGLAGER